MLNGIINTIYRVWNNLIFFLITHTQGVNTKSNSIMILQTSLTVFLKCAEILTLLVLFFPPFSRSVSAKSPPLFSLSLWCYARHQTITKLEKNMSFFIQIPPSVWKFETVVYVPVSLVFLMYLTLHLGIIPIYIIWYRWYVGLRKCLVQNTWGSCNCWYTIRHRRTTFRCYYGNRIYNVEECCL